MRFHSSAGIVLSDFNGGVHRLVQHSGHDVEVLHPHGSLAWMDLHLKLYT